MHPADLRQDGAELVEGVLGDPHVVQIARVEIPRNMVIEMTPMIPRVLAALCAFGSRKAWTPLAIASTPVSAVDPEAKRAGSRTARWRPLRR